MPILTPEEKQAQERFNSAFATPAQIDRTKLTLQQIRAFNTFLRANAPVLMRERDRIENRFANVATNHVSNELARLAEQMERSGQWDQLADDAFDVYIGIKTPDITERQAQKRIAEKRQTIAPRILSELNQAADAIPDLFGELSRMLTVFRVLLAESGAAFVHRQLREAPKGAIFDRVLINKQDEVDFSEVDELLVDLLFGAPPGELLEALRARENRIVVTELTEHLFQDLKDTIQSDIYENVEGGKGAREIASNLSKQFKDKLIDEGFTPKQVKSRMLLWARTEGVVIQNDSLMAMGKEAGMDGKDWSNVGDSRVRTFFTTGGQADHVLNDNDGVIAMNAAFTDGSTDAGSGSRSPFNCRCVSGPAMLENRDVKF